MFHIGLGSIRLTFGFLQIARWILHDSPGFRTAPVLYSVEVGSWRFKERLSGSQTAVPQAPLYDPKRNTPKSKFPLDKFCNPRMIQLSTDHKWSKLLGGIQLVSPRRCNFSTEVRCPEASLELVPATFPRQSLHPRTCHSYSNCSNYI